MTLPRPQQWTEAEVHRLRMLAKRKVSADNTAKSLGRYVGSVKTKALEIASDPLQEGEGEGEIALGPICLAFAVQQAQPLLRGASREDVGRERQYTQQQRRPCRRGRGRR